MAAHFPAPLDSPHYAAQIREFKESMLAQFSQNHYGPSVALHLHTDCRHKNVLGAVMADAAWAEKAAKFHHLQLRSVLDSPETVAETDAHWARLLAGGAVVGQDPVFKSAGRHICD